jgi:hypothetical protein
MRQVTRVLLALLVAVSLAAACGGDDDSDVVAGDGGSNTDADAGDGDTAVSSPPQTDDGMDPGVTWTRIEPTDDLVNPVVATPDEIVPDPDDPNAVLIHFYGGVQECYGARASVVDEDAGQVRIRLEMGGRPDAGDQACIEIAEAQELQLVLDAPVADRDLVAVTT